MGSYRTNFRFPWQQTCQDVSLFCHDDVNRIEAKPLKIESSNLECSLMILNYNPIENGIIANKFKVSMATNVSGCVTFFDMTT